MKEELVKYIDSKINHYRPLMNSNPKTAAYGLVVAILGQIKEKVEELSKEGK